MSTLPPVTRATVARDTPADRATCAIVVPRGPLLRWGVTGTRTSGRSGVDLKDGGHHGSSRSEPGRRRAERWCISPIGRDANATSWGCDGPAGRRRPPEGDREGVRQGRYWKGRNEEGGGTPRPLSQLFVNPLRAS